MKHSDDVWHERDHSVMQIFQHKTEDEPEGKVIPAYQSAQVMAIVCVIPRVAAERALQRPSGAGKSTLLALVALLFGCGTLSGCRDRIYLSTGQVEARIGKEIPPGSSEEQVRAFVNSYNPQLNIYVIRTIKAEEGAFSVHTESHHCVRLHIGSTLVFDRILRLVCAGLSLAR